MKKTKLTAGIGLALGVTIFAGAALANYNTSNGYEIGKNALKGLLRNENYTMNAKFSASVDGKEVGNADITELYDRNGDVKLNSFETSTELTGGNTIGCKCYSQDGDYIYSYDYGDINGVQTTVYKNASEYRGRGTLDAMNTVQNDGDKDVVNKMVRFAELAADTFVGDLKNNIVYVSGDDNSSTYEMNLDAVQIPELANAGLSAMFSAVNSSNRDFEDEYKDPFLALGADPVIKNASLKFTVDKEGRLTYAFANAAAVGEGHEGSVSFEISISDYGTTKPERVDINSLSNVEYFDYNDTDSSFNSVSVVDEAEEAGYHVDEDGNVLDSNDNIVGSIEINGDGEGVVVYNTQQ